MTLPIWQGLAAREENTDIVVLASPTVTVTNEATGGQPSLFSDRAGSNPLGNPFTANADGSIEFYVAPGRYGIEATKGGSTVTWENQLIGTMHGIDSPADGEFAEYDAGNDRWAARQAGYLNPEHATDSGNDAYVSATNTTPPADGVKITRDFQSANTTTTPTLDGKTMTTRDGSALWAGAVSGPHDVQRDQTADTYLVLEPIGTAANVNNAPVARDASGRAKFADPSAAQDAVTKSWHERSQQVAQAWVNFDGTGTVAIRDSYNVDSITDNGVGYYTLNFSVAMDVVGYCLTGSAKSDVSSAGAIVGEAVTGARTVDQIALNVVKTGVGEFDSAYIELAIFGGKT